MNRGPFPSRLRHSGRRPRLAPMVAAIMLAAGHASAQTCDPADIFAPPTPIAALAPGVQTVLGDLDGDGDLDVVLGAFFSTRADILINSGEGVFVSGGSALVGSGHYIALADLNADGFLDLAASQYNDLSVRVRLNNGDGTFGGSFFYPTGAQPFFVVAADFDSDGDTDLATANYADDSVTILFNDGTGQFGGRLDFPAGDGPIQLAAGDLDNDGDPDLAVTNNLGSSVSVLRNAGGGIFVPAATLPVNGNPTPVRIADFDADGLLDLAVGTPGGVAIARNTGGFAFATTHYPAAASFQDLDVGDLDADGYPDVAVIGGVTGIAGVLVNNGDGTLGTQSPVAVPNPFSLALGDVNSDGGIDLVASQVDAPVLLALNQCLIPVLIGQQPVSLAVDAGQNAQFTVGVDLGSAPITYQWRRNGQAIQDGAGVTGSQTDTLVLAGVDAADSDTYDVVVSNNLGGVPSASVFLAVRNSACPYDFNNDGLLNFFDVSAYIAGFSAGCP